MKMKKITMEVIRTFKYRLRGGASGALTVSEEENKRLFELVQNEDGATPFIVFDSDQSRIVLNLKHLLYCHFLCDAGVRDEKEKDEDEEQEVTVVFADGAALSFAVEPDEAEGLDNSIGQFGHLTYLAETSVEENELFNFIDVDGERVFLRAFDVAMMKIPLSVIHEAEVLEDG